MLRLLVFAGRLGLEVYSYYTSTSAVGYRPKKIVVDKHAVNCILYGDCITSCNSIMSGLCCPGISAMLLFAVWEWHRSVIFHATVSIRSS